MQQKIYDFIGIGIGPFNLGLAALSQPLTGVNSLFLDMQSGFNWHPGMLLEHATMQTSFIADLVTLAKFVIRRLRRTEPSPFRPANLADLSATSR